MSEIHDLYCQHAAVVGFSVRKSKDRKIEGTTTVYEKYYVCSAQGKRNIGTKKEECDENYLGSTSSKKLREGKEE